MRGERLALAAACLACLIDPLVASDWPQFRGPTADGQATGTLPLEWSAVKNIAWKVKVPGVAWSQPIVWGDKVYLTTAISDKQTKPAVGMGGGRRPPGGPGEGGPPRPTGPRPTGPRPTDARPGYGRNPAPPDALYRWELHCLDRATGKTLWTALAIEAKPGIPIHRTNTYASETPITDGERIYCYFGMVGLFCFDMSGRPLWQQKIGPYPMMNGWGAGSSPLLVGDRLFLQCDNEKESFLAAFEKKTGKEIWRKPREERSTWSTPFLWKNKERTEIVTAGSRKVVSYDPADGKVLWEISKNTGRCSATPVGNEEMLYLGTGGGPAGAGPLYAIKAGASGVIDLKEGETANAGIAWRQSKGGPPMASPLLHDGRLYIAGTGVVTCYDAQTGKELWKERLPGAKGITSSPWVSGDKLYFLDEEGQTFVLAAGPTFKVLAKNPLGEMCWSSPALADGAIYLRTVDHLYCIK